MGKLNVEVEFDLSKKAVVDTICEAHGFDAAKQSDPKLTKEAFASKVLGTVVGAHLVNIHRKVVAMRAEDSAPKIKNIGVN